MNVRKLENVDTKKITTEKIDVTVGLVPYNGDERGPINLFLSFSNANKDLSKEIKSICTKLHKEKLADVTADNPRKKQLLLYLVMILKIWKLYLRQYQIII